MVAPLFFFSSKIVREANAVGILEVLSTHSAVTSAVQSREKHRVRGKTEEQGAAPGVGFTGQ